MRGNNTGRDRERAKIEGLIFMLCKKARGGGEGGGVIPSPRAHPHARGHTPDRATIPAHACAHAYNRNHRLTDAHAGAGVDKSGHGIRTGEGTGIY